MRDRDRKGERGSKKDDKHVPYSVFVCPLATRELSVLAVLSAILLVPSSGLLPASPSSLPAAAGDRFCRLQPTKQRWLPVSAFKI